MAFFKKNKKEEIVEKDPQKEAAEQKDNLKKLILDALEDKLKALKPTVYDDCVILPKGFTIDIQVSRQEYHDEVKLAQVIFIVKNDEFDEPLIDPVDAQGKTEEDLAAMAASIFQAGVWFPIEQSINKKNPTHIPVDYLNQHYDFDMYNQSVVRIGVSDEKKPVNLAGFIANEIPKYLGSKKYYWIRIYLVQLGEKRNIEVRVNGSVCSQLAEPLKQYIESWEKTEGFVCEKQYVICVQREDDKCPYDKELVMKAAKTAIEMMVEIKDRDGYSAMAKKLEEITDNKALASEIRIFIPEILAKLTLGYREGDSLFILEGEGDEQQQIEFKKTQLRSYFYLQQMLLEFLSTRPPQEHVTNIVTNSVAFRELRKAQQLLKEQGKEVNPAELFVPGTSYRIAEPDYKVW